jgi:hypothetical protein
MVRRGSTNAVELKVVRMLGGHRSPQDAQHAEARAGPGNLHRAISGISA